jgi:cob(I)alamin adenosyltransferase
MTRYYTRKGDDGYTDLLGARRVPKYAPRPEAYGTVDELSAALGLARASTRAPRTREILLGLQKQLCQLMTELAATPEAMARFDPMTSQDVSTLDRLTDEIGAQITLPKQFVVSGDTLSGATLDLARTVARRAERVVARMVHEGILENAEVLRYLNRLSSLLFVLARYEDTVANDPQAPPA